VTGNVTALRNPLGGPERILDRVYLENGDRCAQVPAESGIVPVLLNKVVPVHELIKVDVYVPGCPPPAPRIRLVLEQLLEGQPVSLRGEEIRFG
jgi:NAD-reducing hydrogenase small subunit